MGTIVAACGLQPGQQAVVTNGRVLSLERSVKITVGDFAVMDFVALELQPGKAVLAAIEESQEEGRTRQPADGEQGNAAVQTFYPRSA